MKALLVSLLAASALTASPKALVVEAEWTCYGQTRTLQYTRLGPQTRIEPTPAQPADAYIVLDTEKNQRIVVYRHNSSWRCDPVEPPPQAVGDRPAMAGIPQPPAGIGPQCPIGPRPAGGTNSSVTTEPPAGPTPPSSLTARIPPEPTGAQPAMPQMPAPPPGIGPQGGTGPGAGPNPPGLPAGVGPQTGGGGLPGAGMMPGMGALAMPPPMPEQPMVLQKTTETKELFGRMATKYTLSFHGMDTLEIWAVPQANFGPFFAYRPQPSHRFGPVDLQDQWDGLVRRENLSPLLAIFKQGEREIARFAVTKIETRELAGPEAFFAPPPGYYKSLPDPF